MAASYPAAIKSFSTKVDGVTDVLAEHINSPQDEIVAIETELGTNPKGSAASVAALLAELTTFRTNLLAGWISPGETWTYASATQFTVPGDRTAVYKVGTKLKCTNNSIVKYFTVLSSSYSAPNTTVVITGGNDYSLANAAISSNFYSYAENPQGFPGLFNWTPTFISTGATFTYNIQSGTFSIRGRAITVQGFIKLTGAPGGTTSNQVTIGLPFTAATISGWSMYFSNYWSIVTLPANMTQLLTYVSSGGAVVTLRYTGSGQTAGNLLASALGSNAVMGFAGQYWLP